ncbi:MAG: DedA family protein [Bacteriovoracaceae bacterium]|jgi:membrane protein DedA with SNARE-associated domain|nr:DedA family protein [Bacteriovoracaceae bacterium]
MFDFNVIEFFQAYAYQPGFVYTFIILFMTASSFGLPIPEEMTLVSAGLVAYMASNPKDFPPPYPGAEGVNLTVLCIICFFAVLGSDLVIYMLGRLFEDRIKNSRLFKKLLPDEKFEKIDKLFQKYGYWASGIFRFTPGVRFPGHLSCGIMRVPVWKFLAVDGTAALISVPTQVLLVAAYGEVILGKIKEFKIILGIIILCIIIFLLIKKLITRFKAKGSKV